MILTTTESVPRRKVSKILGVVFGSCVKTKHLGKDLRASLRTLVGGEVRGYTDMMEESKTIATQRLVEQAERLGADAVIGLRYTTAMTMRGAAEILSFGTAVKLEQE